MSIRTNKSYNLDYYDDYEVVGKYDIPGLYPTDYVPDKLIGFNYVMNTKPKNDTGVHFFLDDYQFERLWNNPEPYIDKLSKWDCVLTPDFSLYTDMPKAMQIWNTYRSRLLGQIWQERGLEVIPTVSWSDEKSFEFCFDGLPSDATLAISTVGLGRDKKAKQLFDAGLKEMLNKLSPKMLLVVGEHEINVPEGVAVKRYANERIAKLRERSTKHED